MVFVEKFEFEHLNQRYLEWLQQKREEMERTLDLQHQIERKQIALSLKNYWLVSSREKNIIRYGFDVYEWRSKREYV